MCKHRLGMICAVSGDHRAATQLLTAARQQLSGGQGEPGAISGLAREADLGLKIAECVQCCEVCDVFCSRQGRHFSMSTYIDTIRQGKPSWYVTPAAVLICIPSVDNPFPLGRGIQSCRWDHCRGDVRVYMPLPAAGHGSPGSTVCLPNVNPLSRAGTRRCRAVRAASSARRRCRTFEPSWMSWLQPLA